MAPSPRSATSRAARRYARLLGLAALLAVAALAGPRLVLGPRVVADRVVHRAFVRSIVASGRIETPQRVALGVQLAGSVERVVVEEGQAVKAGEPLFVLESSELRAIAAQAESGVRQAAARLRQVTEVQAPVAEQALRQSSSNRDLAEAALARSSELFARGFVGRAALEEAQRGAQVAQAQWRGAERQLASTGGSGSELAAAHATLAQARASAQATQARLAYATVRAPVTGIVMTRSLQPGDAVQPGKVLMVLVPSGATEVVAQIDEKHLALLRPGLPALVSPDAYERDRIPSELSSVHPAVDAQRGTVEVRLRVPAPPAYLRQDMTVSVDLEVARRPSAVLTRTDTVQDASGAHSWVWKLQDGRVSRQRIEQGLRSATWTEVLRGLAAGDTVLPASESAAAEGRRARAVYRAAVP